MPGKRPVIEVTPSDFNPWRCLQKGVVFESKQAWWRRAVVKMDLGGIKFVGFCIFHSFLHPIRR
jgi:hypothetical protein